MNPGFVNNTNLLFNLTYLYNMITVINCIYILFLFLVHKVSVITPVIPRITIVKMKGPHHGILWSGFIAGVSLTTCVLTGYPVVLISSQAPKIYRLEPKTEEVFMSLWFLT